VRAAQPGQAGPNALQDVTVGMEVTDGNKVRASTTRPPPPPDGHRPRSSAKARAARAHRPLCLKGKLVGEHEDLERQLLEANKAADRARMGGRAEAAEIAQQIRDVEARMEAAVVTFRVRGISYFEREEWLRPTPRGTGSRSGSTRSRRPSALIAACLVDPAATVDQARS
jgi:hypothetical protein